MERNNTRISKAASSYSLAGTTDYAVTRRNTCAPLHRSSAFSFTPLHGTTGTQTSTGASAGPRALSYFRPAAAAARGKFEIKKKNNNNTCAAALSWSAPLVTKTLHTRCRIMRGARRSLARPCRSEQVDGAFPPDSEKQTCETTRNSFCNAVLLPNKQSSRMLPRAHTDDDVMRGAG